MITKKKTATKICAESKNKTGELSSESNNKEKENLMKNKRKRPEEQKESKIIFI